MKLNKIILASSIAAVMMSGFANASAGSGDVRFMGTVTAVTCDIVTEVDGAVNDLVQLGSVVKKTSGEEKNFMLKLKDAASCDLTTTPAAFVSWNVASLNSHGIGNSNGSATDAQVKLTALNSKTANTAIKSGANETEFVSAAMKADGGFKFKAQLIGGDKLGTVDTAAAFAVRYQ